MICIYADESCKDTHKYLILGGICINSNYIDEVTSKLINVRDEHKTYGEVKWSKVSKAKYKFYEDYIKIFFEYCSKDILHFHYLSVDTSTFNNRLHNGGNSELGFDKLIYQLLLHKFGARYGRDNKIQVYLDERTTKNKPDSMTEILNAGVNKKYKINTQPFRRVTFQNSKSSEIIQLNDLLIGAVGFRANNRHKSDTSAKHKIEYSELILSKATELEYPIKMTSKQAKKFSSWDFSYRKAF